MKGTAHMASEQNAGGGIPAVGSPAPDFTLPAHDGSTVRLAELRGTPMVVFFYPKDFTSG
jgi:peroxiredoxin Q/BCP